MKKTKVNILDTLSSVPKKGLYKLKPGANTDDFEVLLKSKTQDKIYLVDQEDLLVSGGGGGGSPAGSDTQIQYNNAGAFGADAGFTRDVAGGNTTILNTTDFGGGEVIDGGIITTGGITKIQQIYSNASVPTYGVGLQIDGTEIKANLSSSNLITGKQNGLEIATGFITLGNLSGGNNTKITIDDVNEHITISNLPAYDDDTAAGVGGLTAGMVYMTTGSGSAPLNAAGILMIKQ